LLEARAPLPYTSPNVSPEVKGTIMTMQRTINLLVTAFFAFAGGMASERLFHVATDAAAADTSGDSVQDFRDGIGRVRLQIGVQNGQSAENLWGEDGKLRLQLGTYDGSVSAAEKGLPVMTLYDNHSHLKILLRIASGRNESPVLVMKDNLDRDRIVMGLSLNGPGEEPFLVYYDNNGGKHAVFGSF
jgi:hypothetical protein